MTDTVFGIKVRMSGLSINRYRRIGRPIIGHCLIGASLVARPKRRWGRRRCTPVLRRARLTQFGSHSHWVGKPSQYVASHLGQLSFPPVLGRLIEYQPFWLGLGGARSPVSGGR